MEFEMITPLRFGATLRSFEPTGNAYRATFDLQSGEAGQYDIIRMGDQSTTYATPKMGTPGEFAEASQGSNKENQVILGFHHDTVYFHNKHVAPNIRNTEALNQALKLITETQMTDDQRSICLNALHRHATRLASHGILPEPEFTPPPLPIGAFQIQRYPDKQSPSSGWISYGGQDLFTNALNRAGADRPIICLDEREPNAQLPQFPKE
jgi:hypothetical protein